MEYQPSQLYERRGATLLDPTLVFAGSDEVLRLRLEMGLSWSYVKELGAVLCLGRFSQR